MTRAVANVHLRMPKSIVSSHATPRIQTEHKHNKCVEQFAHNSNRACTCNCQLHKDFKIKIYNGEMCTIYIILVHIRYGFLCCIWISNGIHRTRLNNLMVLMDKYVMKQITFDGFK